MKKLLLTPSDEQILLPHVMAYLDELRTIEGRPPVPKAMLADEAQLLVRHPQTNWHMIFNGKHRRQNFRGFLAIGFRDNCHPDADLYIAQTYTVSEYRRQGIMRRFFTDWLNSQRKGVKLCMFIIDRNETAKKFWFSLMPSLGYEQMPLAEIYEPDGYTTQYGWRLAL